MANSHQLSLRGHLLFPPIFFIFLTVSHLLLVSFRSIGEESFSREVFEEYVSHLQEKAKEKERKREEEKVPAFFPCT